MGPDGSPGGARRVALTGLRGAILLAMLAAAVMPRDGEARGAPSAPAATAVGDELPALRTARSRTYEQADGSLVARVFAAPQHFRSGAGAWQAIATDLRATAAGYRNRANSFTVRLPRRLQDGDVRFGSGGASLGFSLRGASGTAEVSGSRARYDGALPGVDVVYTSQAAGLKEDLVLRSRRAVRSFTFDLSLSAGVLPRRHATGAIDIVDARGDARMRLARPVMVDAAGAESHQVDVRLRRARGGWSLTLAPDRRWLRDPARRWPVVVDPVVTRGPERDCHMNDDGFANCSDPWIHTGYEWSPALPDEDMMWHGLLRFEVSGAVPSGAHIVDAQMALYKRGGSSVASVITAHPVLKPWTANVNWWQYATGQPWTSPGGDYGPAAASRTVSQWGYNRWNLTQLTRGWVAGTVPNHGVLMTGGEAQSFGSSEASDPATRPYLEITYALPPSIGTPTGALWTRRTQASDHRQEGLYDKLYGATVTATSGGSGVRTIDFAVLNSAGTTVISSPDPSPQSCTPSCGKSRGFTLDTDTVADGTHTIRVTATDQLGLSSTLSWTVTVDRRGDIYSADEHFDTQARLRATDWAKLGARYARRTAQTYIKTREPREVRVRTRATDYDTTDEEAFWVRRTTVDEDPNLEPVAEIIRVRDRTNGSDWTTVETGSLVAALAPWQYAPPANGGQFERRQRVGTVSIQDVWRDAATKLPVKRTLRDASDGSVFATQYWSYAVGRMTDAEAPPNLFHVARPDVVGQEEEEDWGVEAPAAATFVQDEETGTTFQPQSLGSSLELDSGSYCIARTITHHSRLFGDSANGWDPEADPLPEADQGYPGRAAASTGVDVYYVPREGPACGPPDDVRLETPPVAVWSMAADSSEARAWTGFFQREAHFATRNPLSRGGGFAGVEPVTLDTGRTLAYVIEGERGAPSSFLLQAGETTVIVRGPLDGDEVTGVATTMEAM